MITNKWMLLQLFGGEGGASGAAAGDGAGASDAGVNSADAGHQRLLELGVPEDKIRKRAKNPAAKLPEGAVRTAPQMQQPQVKEQAAAAEPTEEPKQDTPKRMTWDEIMADPEYNKQMQATVQGRLKATKQQADNLAKLAPALEILAKSYGLDPVNMDYEALSKAIHEDDNLYEERAEAMGVSKDVARKLDQYEMAQQRQQRQQQDAIRQQAMQRHFTHLEQQAEEMKAMYPGFDLREEMKNPVFARMVSPGSNVPVRNAYYAVHHDQMQAATMQAAAQKTAEKISKSIQAGANRPAENGTSGQAASVTTFDYRKASKAQRDALKREILAAGARGEKLYPGK